MTLAWRFSFYESVATWDWFLAEQAVFPNLHYIPHFGDCVWVLVFWAIVDELWHFVSQSNEFANTDPVLHQ